MGGLPLFGGNEIDLLTDYMGTLKRIAGRIDGAQRYVHVQYFMFANDESGSLLVMAGLATRFAALPVVFAMGVAAFVAHGQDPWTMEAAARLFFAGQTKMILAKEPALIFLIVFLTLAFTGAGRFSVDALIRSRRK